MEYRTKTADKVIRDLSNLREFGVRKLLMVDNIMPHTYFRTLLPRLSECDLGYEIFFEQKANITFAKMKAIADAGINMIQPGIESLSQNVLNLMRKGVRPDQNIATLRYASMLGVYVNWNLLYALPGDLPTDYEAMLEVVPFLEHLAPPSGLSHLSIDRFSPYFDRPEEYKISNIRPMDGYYEAFPASVDIPSIAYHFEGSYDTASRSSPDVVEALKHAVDHWISLWKRTDIPNPALRVFALTSKSFLLFDTRTVAKKPFSLIDTDVAAACLTGNGSERAKVWALENRACVEISGRVVPLATTTPRVFEAFIERFDDVEQALLSDHEHRQFA